MSDVCRSHKNNTSSCVFSGPVCHADIGEMVAQSVAYSYTLISPGVRMAVSSGMCLCWGKPYLGCGFYRMCIAFLPGLR